MLEMNNSFSLLSCMYFSRTNVIFFFSIIFVSSSVFAGSSSTTITPEKQLLNQVVKINTYQYNEQSQSYEVLQYGSAVIIAKNRIITNAHVILESETDTPTGFYEICLSNNFQTVPLCDRSARLISYDPIADLALLEPSKDFSIPPVVLAKNPSPLSIGQAVVIYGYPTIGGKTITRTEGKIAGYENLVYKMDANIDHGNS